MVTAAVVQMQLQTIHKSRAQTSDLLRLQVNPVIQLPRKRSSEDGSAVLRRDEDCFVPITALAERPHLIQLYITAISDDARVSQQSECIELLARSLAKQQGVYKCSSSDGPQYVCLQVSSQQVQVCQLLHWQHRGTTMNSMIETYGPYLQAMVHNIDRKDSDLCDEFLRHLRYYTLAFLPPLVIRSTLPFTLRMQVTSGTAGLTWVPVHLGPGDEQEIYNLNLRDKILMLQVETPDPNDRRHVQLRRRDGFTKESQFHRSAHIPDHQGMKLELMRVLFTMNVDEQCGQTLIHVSSPLWMVNKCGARVNVLLPSLDQSASHQTCLTAQACQVLHCEPCFTSEDETPRVRLLGCSGTAPN